MVDTFQGVFVILVALLPGALSTWGFEREIGSSWSVGLADRFLRFVAWSVVLHVVAAPATFWLWRYYLHEGRLARAEVSWWLWLLAIAYVVVPLAGGLLLGRGTQAGWGWARWLAGRHPAPTAWEHFFGQNEEGTLRIRLKSGKYVAGVYAALSGGVEQSYAAAYPHEPLDLWLVRAVAVDPDTGEFQLDAGGSPLVLGSGMLLRYDEIEFLEFFSSPV